MVVKFSLLCAWKEHELQILEDKVLSKMLQSEDY